MSTFPCVPLPAANPVLVINQQDSSNLGLNVGIPLAVVTVLLVVVTLVSLVVILLKTHRQKLKVQELEEELQLQSLTTGNAYFLQNKNDPFEFLQGRSLEYNYASLEVVGELGEGAFGKVYKACAPGLEWDGWQENDIVAVKTLKEEAESDALQAFVSEVKISSEFQHQNIIRLIGVCTETHQKCMIFEYMDLGSLNCALRDSDPHRPDESPVDQASDKVPITPKDFLSCCVQVAQGLKYLAGLKFVHRDIATRNCLVNHHLVVKIADFGMSREIGITDYYRIGSRNACLPVRWMPPEALLYGKFTVKSDVWSYGVLMWEVYTYARQPYGGISNHQVIDSIKNGQLLHCPDLCPASIFDIMKSCWMHVPQRRPQMAEILARMNNLLQFNSKESGCTAMITDPEGYYNLAFEVEVEEKDLKEMKRVDALLRESFNGKQKENDEDGSEGGVGDGDKTGWEGDGSKGEIEGDGDKDGGEGDGSNGGRDGAKGDEEEYVEMVWKMPSTTQEHDIQQDTYQPHEAIEGDVNSKVS